MRDCIAFCGEFRRSASNSLAVYFDKLIRRSDTHRKTVDILKKSGECSLLACHSPVRYYNKSPCRADLYNRRQDIFLFWIKFCRWRGNFLCGTLDRVYLHLGVVEKAQDTNSFREEQRLGEQDNCLFRDEFRRLAVDCGTPYFQIAIFLVRNCAARLIFRSGAVRFAVSQRYLCGISGELSFSDISLFDSQDSQKAVLIACLFHAAIIFHGFGSANSLAERVFIFAVRKVKIGVSQGVISRID